MTLISQVDQWISEIKNEEDRDLLREKLDGLEKLFYLAESMQKLKQEFRDFVKIVREISEKEDKKMKSY